MPMNAKRLADLMTRKGLRFFVDPSNPAVSFGGRGVNGSYMFVIKLELDGMFLQCRTLDYLTVPADHEHLEAVLRTIAALNYQMRLVKFAWDPKDGEVVVYADAWIMDGELTEQQFGRILDNYLPSVDIGYGRITAAMKTGEDPGADSKQGLPGPIEKLLDKLKSKLEGKKEGGGPFIS